MPFLVSAAWRTGQLSWVPGTQRSGSAYWFFLMLGMALIIAVSIGRYYRVRFGWVRPAFHARDVIGVIGFLALFMASISAQETWRPAISIPAIVVACGIGLLGVSDRQPRSHYLALAAAWCIFASLGALGVPFDVRDVLLDRLIPSGSSSSALAIICCSVKHSSLSPMATPFEEMSALDRLVHEPARLAILTALSACRTCDFIYLQSLTALTKGNLSNHLQKLEDGGLITSEKSFRGRTPRTLLRLSSAGRTAIERHWNRLEDLRGRALTWNEEHSPNANED